ncbi:hypothetical protein [Bradyrhizobium nanningense]|nr:hypothetical protein [Bradyrhizobium nanningense]
MLAKTRRDVDLAALRHPRTTFARATFGFAFVAIAAIKTDT